jgi:thiamine biosynthesis lipoprotein
MSRLETGTERSLPRVLRRMIMPAVFVGALFMVVFWRAPEQTTVPGEMFLGGPTMGTRYAVKIGAPSPISNEDRAALELDIRQALNAVDLSMSTWRDDSELSSFNDYGTEPFGASASFLAVISAALEVGEASGGAFDVTVGPLVDAWGFGPEEVAGDPPGERLAELLATSGAKHLHVDAESETVRKDIEGLRVDLSALAKGYAVDQVAAVLSEAGYTRFMVEIGGEVVTRGTNSAGRPWQIGIEVPDPEERAVHTVVALGDAALATSGDYRNFRVEDGRRISHIIDPRTGRPVAHSLASVSVIAPNCLLADAWATALSVLGPQDGLAKARELGLSALFIFRRDDGTLGEASTEGFGSYRVAGRTKERQP